MTSRHALIVHTRMPAFDRDSGSQDMDNAIRFLLDAGWAVTFVAQEEEDKAEERHARRLRQMGIATYAGFGWVERVLRSNNFDLALTSFWEPSEAVLPVIRELSPSTRIIVNSMDLHFLRHARGAFATDTTLDKKYGDETSRELNTYNAADAVIAVSDKERDLLREFLSSDRIYTLPLSENIARSEVPLAQRRGMYFVGNFRHVPNRRALEYVAGEVLPLIDQDLLEAHPLTVIGNWLESAPIEVDRTALGLNLVGWVPTVKPYVEQSRLAVVPLLNGAGVKRKVIQSMMAYTPVVTTPVGAESLDLEQGVHSLIAADAADMASGITRVLTDDDLWRQLADAGASHVDERHGCETIRRCFNKIVDDVMAQAPRVIVAGGDSDGPTGDRGTLTTDAIRQRVQMVTEPDAVVVIATNGDADLEDLGAQKVWPFPRDREGAWAGFEPVDGPAAVNHLDALRLAGGRYFVLPRSLFSWRHRFPELVDHLETHGYRIHDDEHFLMYDLVPPRRVADAPPALRVQILGTYDPIRTGPSPLLTRELDSSEHLEITQRWAPAGSNQAVELAAEAESADYTVLLDDRAILPGRFLDDLISLQLALGVDRAQPAHVSGPTSGPPITERQRGVIAREVDNVTPLPVLSVKSGADYEGPTALLDAVTIGLKQPLGPQPEALVDSFATVRRVWTDGLEFTEPVAMNLAPAISVLISTYNRVELLRDCLQSFAEQTIGRDQFEVVLVDDGSENSVVHELAAEFESALNVTAVGIEHVGRSAAKNLCALLAQAPIVLFFDDDDQATPDYLERHLAGHEAKPEEGVAILGHTNWDPELELSPLMHFITDVERLMFAYERLSDGQELDWRGFWEGRISCKRSLLMRHGLHDQRLNYSIDVEMAWRLAPHGLRVVYDASAVSIMARPLDYEGFSARTNAKGRANAIIADLHSGTPMAAQLRLDQARSLWAEKGSSLSALRRRVMALENRVDADPSVLPELQAAYRESFTLLNAQGVVGEPYEGMTMTSLPTTVTPFENTDPEFLYDGSPEAASSKPLLSISLPVWSRTPELAAMVQGTIDRIWEVSRIPTEVIAIDNGSPFEVPLNCKVYRYPENKGVSTGWNTGIRLSSAATVVVLNSDCKLEPGWDEALYEAANDGRRVAFPYTDHCDGKGFTQPDQGGTAGWCFMLTKALYEEVGVFDEWFNPAFCEDTDYWHRAWHLGIELTPVPAARVIHARRTTASTHPHVDWLLTGHRYKYGWKHGVDPMAAPPYYGREITEYNGSFEVPS